ncbi:MAG: hypothetical protein QOK17_2418 [Sphingomonadales bacterium]|jgi:hypothetical protein|nr:hypothetical protein [Sphingomonadales bacterium]
MEPRVASSVLVTALIRKAEAEGGFAAVLSKGDETAGTILLLLTERGANPQILERLLQPDGRYVWGRSTEGAAEVPALIARRRRFDPDLWVLELDVPSGERFAAEMTAFD